MTFVATVLTLGLYQPGPPAENGWRMTFDEEFNGDSLDASKWTSDNGGANPSALFLSTRWPEDVVVRDGACHLVTLKQTRSPGKPWTSGDIWTRTFRQQYGYFEARIRYAKASGLNNAFWLKNGAHDQGTPFEIDVNEGHYPSEVNTNLHDWTGGVDKGKGEKRLFPEDLSQDFHVYGVEWNETELIWYVDGQSIRRLPNTVAHGPAEILLSTMVVRWAGPVSDALNNSSMDVDWVHAYTRK